MAIPRIKRVALAEMGAARLGFAKLSTGVLDLAIPRAKGVAQAEMGAGLGFAKSGTCVLYLAKPRMRRAVMARACGRCACSRGGGGHPGGHRCCCRPVGDGGHVNNTGRARRPVRVVRTFFIKKKISRRTLYTPAP